MNSKLVYFLPFLMLFSCSEESDKPQTNETPKEAKQATQNTQLEEEHPHFDPIDGTDYLNIDLSQSLEGKSLEELRLLRNAIFARQGYLFMRADLRGHFSKYKWYDSLMYARWEYEEMGEDAVIDFSEEETEFIKRVKAKEEELLAENYIERNGYTYANVNNIVNRFQFDNLDQGFLDKVSQNGFAIVPNSNIQLFHLYEQNDYQQVPNFVTTDLFLQLYHMYFSYLLRSLEEGVFYTRTANLSKAMYQQALKDYQDPQKTDQKEAAAFSAVFFQVGTRILTGKDQMLPLELVEIADAEFNKINKAEDDTSPFLGYAQVEFPYSLFKPRGHYTRSDTLKNYFKAMMWLQKGEMCMDDETFDNAIYMAQLLSRTKLGDEKAYKVFRSVYEPIKFIIGDPDNISVYDLAQEADINKNTFASIDRTSLKERMLKLERNRIKPADQLSCLNKINLFPQRYLFDNEVLQDLVDTDSKVTKRPYPKGIDVFGVLGVTAAEDLLLNHYKEQEKWPEFSKYYKELKDKSKSRPTASVYAKWVDCLVAMQQPQEDSPSFMKLPSWDKKELNTALASWAELKHDAILYAEQPFGAECGGGGPPPPITVGYVEPNVKFWKSIGELVNSTNDILKQYNLFTGEIKNKSVRIEKMAQFLLQAAEKEVRGETLSEEEYNTIEIIGSTVEYITISLLPQWVDNWSLVKGPDREVSVVADIYTANAENNPKKGVVHVGVGPVNDLYVVVEIEGLLYLTRGAVFSYYEFLEPMGSRLTDEEWQKRIKAGELPAIPDWMKEIIYDKNPPKPDEGIFYSSGC